MYKQTITSVNIGVTWGFKLGGGGQKSGSAPESEENIKIGGAKDMSCPCTKKTGGATAPPRPPQITPMSVQKGKKKKVLDRHKQLLLSH